MLNRILHQLLQAEKEGTLAMDFFNHDPKAHAKNEIKKLPNETITNIFKYIFQHILLFIGIFVFKRFYWIFHWRKTFIYLYLPSYINCRFYYHFLIYLGNI